MKTTVIAIVLVYLVAIVAIIMLTGRKVKTYYDFALGGGSIPWWVVTGTMFASTVGGATMIGYVGSYKTIGLQWAWVPFISFFVGSLVIGFLLAGRLKKLNQYTTADIFKLRYGKGARLIAAALNCLGEMAVVASMMASFATMANGYLGIDYMTCMVIAIVIFFVTAAAGGLKGVAYTDTLQGLVIFITVFIVAIISMGRLGENGGFAAIEPHLLNPFASNSPWMNMLGTIVSGGLMGAVMQSLFIQRINACSSAAEAKKAAIANAILCGVFMVGFISVIGLSASTYLPADVTGNNVITEILATMPDILAAFYTAAILAAVLTTANSLLLSCSMTFVRDFVGGIKELNDKQSLVMSRAFILAIDLLAFVVIQYMDGVLSWILITYTILATLFVPMYGGLLFKQMTPASGVLGLALGGGIAVVWEVLKMFSLLPASLAAIHSIFPGIVLGIVGLLLGTLSKNKSTPEQLRVVDCFRNNLPYEE